MDRSITPPNMRHGLNYMPHGEYRHHDDDYKMMGYNKRHNPSSPSYDHPSGPGMMPPVGGSQYFNPNFDRNSPGYYENPHSSAKKQKRDW